MNIFARLFRKALPDAADRNPPATSAARRTAVGADIATADRAARESAAAERVAQARAAESHTALRLEDGSLSDAGELEQLISGSASSRIKRMAAERLQDPEKLRRLLREFKGRDKNVYKILKQKCDALNAEERQEAAAAAALTALCASVERHAARSFDPAYAATFAQLEARWRALDPRPDRSLEERYQQAARRCAAVIDAERLRAIHKAAADQALEAEAAAHERERQAAQDAAEVRSQVDAEAESLRSREEAAARAAEERARLEIRAAEDQLWRQLGGLLRKAHDALAVGNTQQAAGLRRALEEKWPASPSVPAHLTRQLQKLDVRLEELKQWKDYAVAPKRLELIEEMEALVGVVEEPQTLARRIKALQEDWRTISKGIAVAGPDDWERFQRASQAAYQPCQEYFAAQALLRQRHLASRAELLQRLKAFEAADQGERTDWRLLARVMREAPQEWRQYFPVDRDANQPLQSDFEAVLARLQQRLDAWHQRNVADKQSLIRRAGQLAAAEDAHAAIEAVKQLQILWKETGQAPRDQEQSLWNEFRELCDAIYRRRQQAFAEYTARLEATRLQAVAMCEEIERAASLEGPPLLEQGAKIADWRAAFEALDDMPRNDAQALTERFERALGRLETQLAQQALRDAEQSFVDFFAAGRRVRAYARAVADQAEAAVQAALEQDAKDFIAGVRRWPKGGLITIKQSLASVQALRVEQPVQPVDLAAGERALRTLCIRAELLSELPTPPEDDALRREYQVQRLMSGMGQGNQTESSAFDELALEWIRMAAVAPALGDALEARFLRCHARRPPSSVRPSALDGRAAQRSARTIPEAFPGRRGQRRRSAP